MSSPLTAAELTLMGDSDAIECDGDSCVLGFGPSFPLARPHDSMP